MSDLGVRTWGNSPDGVTVMLTGTYQMEGEVSRRLLERCRRCWCPARAVTAVALLADEIGQDGPASRPSSTGCSTCC